RAAARADAPVLAALDAVDARTADVNASCMIAVAVRTAGIVVRPVGAALVLEAPINAAPRGTLPRLTAAIPVLRDLARAGFAMCRPTGAAGAARRTRHAIGAGPGRRRQRIVAT